MTMPDAVQRQLLRWAADTVGELSADRVPAALRPVARFRPARRASLGAVQLSAALEHDSAFRAAVAEHIRGLPADPSSSAELAERAAAAQLWELPDAAALLDEAADTAEVATLRREVERLRAELAASRSGAPRPPAPVEPAPAADPGGDRAALDKLRQRLRDQGAQLRAAKDDAAEAEQRATVELKALKVAHERAQGELKNARDRLEQEQARADRAQHQLTMLQAADRSSRDAAHRRIELLLDTVEQASRGLRREWQLTSGGPDPAERVAESLTPPMHNLLALPHSHLIVDGYNVTKTGYPQLTLAEQRDRLVRGLAALGARESTEITVVFDGAAVVVPQARFRGIRVLYSPAGVTADDVIRQLVAAEPAGRVLLVVTADREIIRSVGRPGVRTVPPTELLTTLRH